MIFTSALARKVLAGIVTVKSVVVPVLLVESVAPVWNPETLSIDCCSHVRFPEASVARIVDDAPSELGNTMEYPAPALENVTVVEAMRAFMYVAAPARFHAPVRE